LWIACGAAAGMASAYHAPLAGSLFIAEILFGTLMLASLGPVVIAAVVALLTTQLLAPAPARSTKSILAARSRARIMR
jgi:CIC family chloride channel protein